MRYGLKDCCNIIVLDIDIHTKNIFVDGQKVRQTDRQTDRKQMETFWNQINPFNTKYFQWTLPIIVLD